MAVVARGAVAATALGEFSIPTCTAGLTVSAGMDTAGSVGIVNGAISGANSMRRTGCVAVRTGGDNSF